MNTSMNKAVIMAGGFGTRLRPLTMKLPKPMVPIMNLSMMEHIVNLLKNHGITDIVSLLYFQPDSITSHFEDGSKYGINMQYVKAQDDYGTAGSVRNAGEHLDKRFIVISGDVLTDFDLTKAIDYHISKQAKATILLTRHTQPLQYGIVMTDQEGRITRFLEKPSWGQVFSDTINTGIYILEPDVLDLIPYRKEFDFSKDLFPTMLAKNMPLYGYIADGYWRDVGNLDEYQIGQSDALNGELKVTFKGTKRPDGVIIGENCIISPTATFSGKVMLGNNVTIGEHAHLTDCVIGNDVTIGGGAKLTRVTLWNNVTIGDFARLTDDVVCNGVSIGQSAVINENVFISNDCNIGKSAILNANIKLWPNKNVEEGAVLSRSLVQEEKWQRELFYEARISGLSNIEIHPEFVAKLGTALGLSIGANSTIIASRAPDNCSRIMKRAMIAGVASVGVNIVDLQVTSIPQSRQELRSGKYDAGIHIRSSPRNPEMHDIIIFSKDGRDISTSVAKKIERYFFGEDILRVPEENMGTITLNPTTNEAYMNRYTNSIDIELLRKRKYKILIDYSYGLAASILPNLLGYCNAEVISLNNYVNSLNNFNPDSQFLQMPKEMDEASKIMRSLDYEIGFQVEAGAEKVRMIDERGVWYSHSRLLTIVTKLYLETHRHLEPYKIAISILAGSEIDEIAKDYNVEVVRIKNSHAAMMESTLDEKVKFVGGSYGGFIFTDFLFAADAMFTVGQILEMLAKSNLRISDLDKKLPQYYQKSIIVHVPWEKKGTIMRRAMEASEGMERMLVEGVKIFKEEGSVLLYPEKESANFVVLSNSKEPEAAESLANYYAGLITQWKEEK